MNTFHLSKLAPEFSFAGFSWPRYTAVLPTGSLQSRKAARARIWCGAYYAAPRPIECNSDCERGFYLSSHGAPSLRWQWADDVAQSIGHVGWFTDERGDGDTVRGVVFRLPRSKGFLAGWSMGESMASAVDYSTVYADETSAALAADGLAYWVSEHALENEAREREESESEGGEK